MDNTSDTSQDYMEYDATDASAHDADAAAEPHLEQTAFGEYEVYPDASYGPFSPGSNAIHESEFHSLETAWDHIHHGVGLDIHGSAEDKATFDNMLADDMMHSAAFRQTIEDIGNDTTHTQRIELGHNQPGTIISHNDAVDLTDLTWFPQTPESGQHNELTHTEIIDNILEQGHFAQTHDPHHYEASMRQVGIDGQNRIRDEWGQAHVVSQDAATWEDGSISAQVQFVNGQDEDLEVDRDANITQVRAPRDR